MTVVNVMGTNPQGVVVQLAPHQVAAMVTEKILVVGRTGQGKSYTAGRLVEIMLGAGQRVCILDPTGVWWGLRTSASGRQDGFPVAIIGGDHGDAPLPESSGGAVARAVAEGSTSFVIDVSGFGQGEKTRWATEFAEELYKRNREPLMLVLDECDEFLPLRAQPDETTMCHRFDRIVRRGRTRGFGCMMISQRPAAIAAGARSQAGMLVAHQLMSELDRKAIKGWVDAQDDTEAARSVMASMASLKRGEAWVWSPVGPVKLFERLAIASKTTWDSSSTPKAGERRAEPLTRVDMGELAEALRTIDADEHAGEDIRTLKQARKRIAELERRVDELSSGTPADPDPAYGLFVEGEAQRLVERIRDAVLSHLRDFLSEVQRAAPITEREQQLAAQVLEAVQPQTAEPKPAKTASAPATVPAADLPSGERRVLRAIAQWRALGTDTPTADQVAFLANYSPGGGAYTGLLARMGSDGLINRCGGAIELTARGEEAIGEVDLDLGTLAEFHQRVVGVLERSPKSTPGMVRSLRAMLARGPDAWTVEDLADAIGMAAYGGAFTKALGKLGKLGLTTRPRRGVIAPSPTLFPEGLP